MDKIEFKEKLNYYSIDNNLFIIGSGEKCDPEFNYGRKPKLEKFAVKLFLDKELAVFWNLDLQRKYFGEDKVTLSVSLRKKEWSYYLDRIEDYFAEYRELGKQGSGKWHKICIVRFNCLDRFLENFYDYMKINNYDETYPHFGKSIDDEDEMESDRVRRERFSTTAWKRDSRFREKVLESYSYMCAICRCSIPSVLQAAHEHGFEPNESNWDDPLHGICLCANHHLMYDRKLIDIDKKKNALTIIDKAIEKDPLNTVFFTTFNGVLLQQRKVER